MLRRSMRSRMRNPTRTSFYPLSRQLGVGVEVEVNLEEQVAVGRESFRRILEYSVFYISDWV